MGRQYPHAITDAVYRMLEKDPALRLSSMKEVKALKTYFFSALAIVSTAVIGFIVYSAVYQPTSHDSYVEQSQRPDKQTSAPPMAPLV